MKRLKNILSMVVVTGLVMSAFNASATGICVNKYINVSSEFFSSETFDVEFFGGLYENAKKIMERKVHVKYTANYKITINRLSSKGREVEYKIDDDKKRIDIFVSYLDFEDLENILASILVRAQIHSVCDTFNQSLENAFSQMCLQNSYENTNIYYVLVAKLIEKKADILNDFIRLRDLMCDVEILFGVRDIALDRSIGEEVLMDIGVSQTKIQRIKLTKSLDCIRVV